MIDPDCTCVLYRPELEILNISHNLPWRMLFNVKKVKEKLPHTFSIRIQFSVMVKICVSSKKSMPLDVKKHYTYTKLTLLSSALKWTLSLNSN